MYVNGVAGSPHSFFRALICLVAAAVPGRARGTIARGGGSGGN